MPDNNEVMEAVKPVLGLLQKKGANLLMWAVLGLVGSSAAILPVVQSTRVEGGHTFLDAADFHIMGPDRAPAGSLVRLTVHYTKPTDVVWYTTTDYEKYGVQGADMVFSAPIGEVVVICSIIRGGKLYLTTKTVEIYDPAVEPPESPVTPLEPEPTPEPVEPEKPSLTFVGLRIVELATKHNMPVEEAADMAKNLREAIRIAGDKSPAELLDVTNELNGKRDSPLDDEVRVFLSSLAQDRHLVTKEQHRDIWLEMAAGFEEYSQ